MISIKYEGTLQDYSGYGNANRAFVTALFSAGVNITTEVIRQVPEKANYGIEEEIAMNLKNRDIPYKIKIIHLTPDLYPIHKEKGVYNIGHLFWETSKLPRQWIDPSNGIDEIWTASEQMARMIAESGVKTKVFCFPQPIMTQNAFENIVPFTTQYPKDFYFYSIFQWIDRKNPRGLLRAYWKEFEGNDKVSLVLKTYRITYTESEFELLKADIAKWKAELKLKHYPKIYLLSKLLSENQMGRLHTMGDCFINPSSGEGWNRPMEEAMLYGKPVISGNNGGITDIMPLTYYYPVPSVSQNVTEASWIPWYTKDMTWKVLDEKELQKQMREVFENYDKALKVGRNAQEYVIENFNMQTVGLQMKKRLEDIYATL